MLVFWVIINSFLLLDTKPGLSPRAVQRGPAPARPRGLTRGTDQHPAAAAAPSGDTCPLH